MDPFIKLCIAGLLLAWGTFIVGGIAMALLKARQAKAGKQ